MLLEWAPTKELCCYGLSWLEEEYCMKLIDMEVYRITVVVKVDIDESRISNCIGYIRSLVLWTGDRIQTNDKEYRRC